MAIIITGVAGFIGSNFIRQVIADYAEPIINVDNLTYAGNLANLGDASKMENYKFKLILMKFS